MMENVPTDKKLYERIKRKVKGEMVWPSAYASLQLVRQYKAAGGKYRRMARGGLTKWLEEKWVDLSRPKPGGGYEDCGRDEARGEDYPKCVPAAKAASMSASERRSAIKRKRAAQGGKLHKDAVHVATFADALKHRKK
jgi:hypothetical protein